MYSKPGRTSKMKCLEKLVNSDKPLTSFAKNSILDVWKGSEYASENHSSTNPAGSFKFTNTVWKVSVLGVFLIRTFPHSDWIRRNTQFLSIFSPDAGKYRPEKLWIQTLFTQSKVLRALASFFCKFKPKSISGGNSVNQQKTHRFFGWTDLLLKIAVL